MIEIEQLQMKKIDQYGGKLLKAVRLSYCLFIPMHAEHRLLTRHDDAR